MEPPVKQQKASHQDEERSASGGVGPRHLCLQSKAASWPCVIRNAPCSLHTPQLTVSSAPAGELAAEYDNLVVELRRKPRCEKVIEATVPGGKEFTEMRALPSAFECTSRACGFAWSSYCCRPSARLL
jgi:hypothetical protein